MPSVQRVWFTARFGCTERRKIGIHPIEHYNKVSDFPLKGLSL
jgi:hypothetical protein